MRYHAFWCAVVALLAAALPAQADLVGHWNFNEGSGQVAGDSAPGGTVADDGWLGTDASVEASDPTWIGGGVYGGALSFDGGDRVTAAHSPELMPTTAITVAGWMKLDVPVPSHGAHYNLATKLDWSNRDGYSLSFNNPHNDNLFFRICHGSGYTDASWNAGGLNTDQWYHLAGTYDGSTIRLYVDGNEVDTTGYSGSIDPTTNALTFGANAEADIDDVRVYDHVLTAGEVSNLAVRGTAKPVGSYAQAVLDDGPIAYWRLDEDAGPKAKNLGSIGGEANGTYAGGVSFGQPSLVATETSPSILLNGTNARVDVPDHNQINTGGPWEDKSVELWFSAPDVQTRQVLYEQGGHTRGLNVYVENGKLYVGAWNRSETSWEPIWLSTDVEPDTPYMVDLVLDGVPSGTTGEVLGYLNGELFDSATGMSMLWSHANDCAIGAMIENAVFYDPGGGSGNVSGDGLYFGGWLDEISLYNTALSPERIRERYAESVVPEPATIALFAAALAGLGLRRRRRLDADR